MLKHAGDVDTVTFVPSRKSRSNPVESLLEETQWGASTWIEDALEVLDTEVDTHVPDEDRFAARDVSDEHVLLIDDTFTRGATSMSAARALYQAGASEVTIVVLGRHADVEWMTDGYLAAARGRAERDEFCPVCSRQLVQASGTHQSGDGQSSLDDWEPPEDDWEPPDPDTWESPVDPWSQPPADPGDTPSHDPWAEPAPIASTSASRKASPTPPTRTPRAAALTSTAPGGADRGTGRSADATASGPADPPDEPSRLSESAALTMTVILAAPFALVFILPILLSNIGISLNPLDRYGGLWGPAGFNGYAIFMVFALTAGGVNWLLKSIHKAAAVGLFTIAAMGVTALFLAPLLATSTGSSEGSEGSAPTDAQAFRAAVNARAPEHGVAAITLGEAQNAIESVCPAVDEGLTIPEARSQVEDYADQEGIPDDVAEQISLMTEMVIEFSDSLC
ncbi:ComF family protein [Nocardioides hungaricus]